MRIHVLYSNYSHIKIIFESDTCMYKHVKAKTRETLIVHLRCAEQSTLIYTGNRRIKVRFDVYYKFVYVLGTSYVCAVVQIINITERIKY